MQQERIFSKEQALQKLKHYCAYQERCHVEVKEKLYSYGLHKGEVEELMSQLIEENYLNEERYAIQFAGGKFRLKHWGKLKIKYELKLRQVSEYCIKKAVKQIDDELYANSLEKLAHEKWRQLRAEKNIYIRKKKVKLYLIQKGYEQAMVYDLVDSMK